MPEVEGEYEGSFGVSFTGWPDSEKFNLIEAIIKGGDYELEGSAVVTLEFDLADYAPDRY
jgi:hypothetical protein